MHALRSSRLLTRLILGGFALALAVAMLSPIVKPQSFQLLCLGNGGVQLMLLDASGDEAPAAGHHLDCPLCLTVVPPPLLFAVHEPATLSVGAWMRGNAQRIARAPAPSLPARGPPLNA